MSGRDDAVRQESAPANAGGQQDSGRDAAGRFRPGVSGNARGRPAGSRNAASVALDALAEGEAERVLRSMVVRATTGCPRAGELVLSRVWPVPKGRRVPVALPPVGDASGVHEGLARVVEAVSDGTISAEEGRAIAAVLEAQLRVIEAVELEARLAALEQEVAAQRAAARGR